MYKIGYNSCTTLRKLCVSKHNQKMCLNWAQEKRSWTIDNWKKIVWSDKSRFTIFQNDGKIRVWHLQKEKYDINCFVPTIKHGGGGS